MSVNYDCKCLEIVFVYYVCTQRCFCILCYVIPCLYIMFVYYGMFTQCVCLLFKGYFSGLIVVRNKQNSSQNMLSLNKLSLTFCSRCFIGMALGYPPPSPVGQFAPLTPMNMSAGIDLSSSGGGGGSYSPPHNLSPKGGASSASINGYNSQVRVI